MVNPLNRLSDLSNGELCFILLYGVFLCRSIKKVKEVKSQSTKRLCRRRNPLIFTWKIPEWFLGK